MKRFTKQNNDGSYSVDIPDYEKPPYPIITQEALDRLGQFEDLGMEPADIPPKHMLKEYLSIFHLVNEIGGPRCLKLIIEADKDGRLLVFNRRTDKNEHGVPILKPALNYPEYDPVHILSNYEDLFEQLIKSIGTK